MVIVYWSINQSYIKYMICIFTLCKKINCGKFISVYVPTLKDSDMYYNSAFGSSVSYTVYYSISSHYAYIISDYIDTIMRVI